MKNIGFIYWFSYKNPEMTEEEGNTYYLQCLIISNDKDQVSSWGTSEAVSFCKENDYIFLDEYWVEDIYEKLLSKDEETLFNWDKDVGKFLRGKYQGCLEKVLNSKQCFNVFIDANSDEGATSILEEFSKNHGKNMRISTCSKSIIPVALIGETIDW